MCIFPMATPYNLRSRRKSSQPAQESVRTSQSRRKKHSKKDEPEPKRDHDQKYFLSLHVEDPVENPKKCLILEDEENDESNEKQYNTNDVVTDGIEELVGEEEEEEKEDDTAEVMEGGAGDPNGTDSSDDGDEAPEDVSLSVAKQQVLEQFHQQNTASER